MHLGVYVHVAGNVGSCSGSMKVMHCCLVANKIYNHTKKHVDRKATRTLTGKMIEDMYMSSFLPKASINHLKQITR